MSDFLIRTVGGPHPGTRVAQDMAWPLPDELPDSGGRYVKVSESQLGRDFPHVLRGAQYEWQAAPWLIDAAEKYAFSSEARPALDVERLDEALHNIYERRYGAIETGAPPVTVFGEIAAGIAAEYARLTAAEAASDE